MELFPRSQPLERVADTGEASAPGMDRGIAIRTAVRESTPRAPREGLGDGARTLVVLAASLGAHVAFAAILAALPAASSMLAVSAPTIEVEMAFPIEEAPPPVEVPEPEIVPEPIAPTPEPIARTERRAEPEREIEPEPAAPEPPPQAPAAMAPPSIDDVFAEPAPPLETMGAASGGFAIAAGSPDGRAGGRAGGTGTGIGSGGGGRAEVPSGPSADEIRRARRAYGEQV